MVLSYFIFSIPELIKCFQQMPVSLSSEPSALASIVPVVCTVNTEQVQLHNRWAAKISIVQSEINTGLD